MYVNDSRNVLAGLDVGRKAHEGCGGADEERVDEYGERLHEALLDGVRDACACTCVRGGTHTCFVGVEAALDAVHDAASGKSAESCVKRECVLENRAEHGGNIRDVVYDNAEGDDDVDGSHEGNEVACDGGNFLGTFPDAKCEEGG